MKALIPVLALLTLVACAPQQPLGPATKAPKPAPNVPTTQSAAMPGQCMGLIAAERDQCLRKFGSSGAGSSAPTAPPASPTSQPPR